jgi:RNA polymerase sigma-70 factor (ECF subfamily)
MPEQNINNEKEIVTRLRRGESRAFDEIYNFYARRVYRFAFSFLNNKPDSEGIVQEVFLRVWKNRKNIKEYYLFKAFLFTISYNMIMDKLRERLNERKFKAFLRKQAITTDSDTEKQIEYSNLNELYQDTVEHLPKRRRIIYKLHRNKGLTYNEIANKLDISPKTVENQMTSALKYIRGKLGPESLHMILFFYLFV